MPYLIFILGGAALAWILIETEHAIEAFVVFLVFCILLYVAPSLAIYFAGAILALGVLALVVSFWQFFVSLVLGFLMFLLFVGGLLNAIKVLAK